MLAERAQKDRYVCYYRVSTKRQGQSGLGLEAQQQAVRDFLNGNGSDIVAEFTEIESGKRSDRPELNKALAACRTYQAKLVIAKMDRLARNVAFISNLMESGVEFTAVDFPQANRLTVHLLAAVAEHEREMISKRTREALRAAKARGVKLGNPQNLTNEARLVGSLRGNEKKAAIADARAKDLAPILQEIQDSGAQSLRQIVRELNRRNVPTVRGGDWSAMQVKNVLDRL